MQGGQFYTCDVHSNFRMKKKTTWDITVLQGKIENINPATATILFLTKQLLILIDIGVHQ